MNKHYKEIAEVVIPAHDGEERLTTLHVFDISDEKADELCSICYEKDARNGDVIAMHDAIRFDLMALDDYGVMPGAPFHRYDVRFEMPHTVLLWDTLSYNV